MFWYGLLVLGFWVGFVGAGFGLGWVGCCWCWFGVWVGGMIVWGLVVGDCVLVGFVSWWDLFYRFYLFLFGWGFAFVVFCLRCLGVIFVCEWVGFGCVFGLWCLCVFD